MPLLLPADGEASGKPYDIRERSFQLALRILNVAASIPGTPEGSVVRHQIARAGTSIGANVEESYGTQSKADRRKSLVVARKEALELRYWLRIIQGRWPAAVDVGQDLQEATEVARILGRLIQLLV